MKLVFGLLAGAFVGAVLALLLLLFNPMGSLDDERTLRSATLSLPVAGQGTSLVMQNGTGYPWLVTKPTSAQAPRLDGMRSAVTVMLSSAPKSRVVAYVAQIRTLNQDGRLLAGNLVETSLWHVVLPGRGSFVVYGQDNVWPIARELVVPFARNASWAGEVSGVTTIGPVGDRARVIGINGEFAGQRGTAELKQTVRAASASIGITDMSATLAVSLQPAVGAASADALVAGEVLQ